MFLALEIFFATYKQRGDIVSVSNDLDFCYSFDLNNTLVTLRMIAEKTQNLHLHLQFTIYIYIYNLHL